MSYAGLAGNQTISFSNLQNAVNNGYFVLKAAITSTAEQITKADANTHVYIDVNYAPYSAKANNQLVVKDDLRGGFTVYGQTTSCVVPETDILIAPNITRKARDMKEGDLVYTQHESLGTWGYYKVLTLGRSIQPILLISTSEGEIKCSTTHLIFRSGEFVEAKDLVVGDSILHLNGPAIINQITYSGEGTVIEFTIDDAHTYVAAGFMSHNKCILVGWTNCFLACSNGVTSFSTNIQYSGVLQVGTVLTGTGNCQPQTTSSFYYYIGGFLEIGYNGTNFVINSLGSCSSCTTSTTTTTTTTPSTFNVTFYGVMGAQSNSQETLYYSTDNSTWTPIAQAFTNTCGILDVFSVNNGDTVYLSVGDPASTVYFYNATNSSTCPANSANYCGLGNPYFTTITANTDIAVTQYVAGGNILAC